MISGFTLHAVELTQSESLILSRYFEETFKNSEFGYVLNQMKPICAIGFHTIDPLYPGIKRHRSDVFLKEGAPLWQKLGLTDRAHSPFTHVVCQSDYDGNMMGIRFIHSDLLEETIDNHLPLFRFALGPALTPQSLRQKLEDSKSSLEDVLNKNNVLIGIALGFGADNSLVVSRQERIADEFCPREHPLLKPVLVRMSRESTPEDFLDSGVDNPRDLFHLSVHPKAIEKPLQPSFGFSTLKEEYEWQKEVISHPSEQLMKERPVFCFGRLKESKESDKLVRKLESTQKKIQESLKKPTFFEDTIFAMTGKRPKIKKKESSTRFLAFTANEKKSFPAAIAASINWIAKEESDCFFEGFIKGMKEADRSLQNQPLDLRKKRHIFYEKPVYEKLVEAKRNLLATETFFQNLDRDSEYIDFHSKTLFVKIQRPGKGAQYKNQRHVKVHCTLTMGTEDELLLDTRAAGIPKTLDLAECIDGLRMGMSGMRVGEEREIVMHPKWAYGLYTMLGKAAAVKAIIRLVDIESDDSFDFPPPTPLKIASEIPDDVEEKCKEQQRKAGYYRGYQTWSHYKRWPDYTLSQVLTAFAKIRSGQKLSYPPGIDPRRVINRLHWNIYAQEDYELLY